jgi:hypothetical protein
MLFKSFGPISEMFHNSQQLKFDVTKDEIPPNLSSVAVKDLKKINRNISILCALPP